MPATSDRRSIASAAFALALFGQIAPLHAHPMPDTEIAVARSARSLDLVIRLPASDLLLVLPPRLPRDMRTLVSRNQSDLRAYFAVHAHLRTRQGRTVPLTIGSIRLKSERDPNVGNYAELEVNASAMVAGGVPLSLAYDGIVHRIANHRVQVRTRTGRSLGIIRYSLATKIAPPLPLPRAPF